MSLLGYMFGSIWTQIWFSQLGGVLGSGGVEARDATQCPMMYMIVRAQRVIWPQMPLVSRLGALSLPTITFSWKPYKTLCILSTHFILLLACPITWSEPPCLLPSSWGVIAGGQSPHPFCLLSWLGSTWHLAVKQHSCIWGGWRNQLKGLSSLVEDGTGMIKGLIWKLWGMLWNNGCTVDFWNVQWRLMRQIPILLAKLDKQWLEGEQEISN